jgi:hypothetical protein
MVNVFAGANDGSTANNSKFGAISMTLGQFRLASEAGAPATSYLTTYNAAYFANLYKLGLGLA